jgi:hypothetical protein
MARSSKLGYPQKAYHKHVSILASLSRDRFLGDRSGHQRWDHFSSLTLFNNQYNKGGIITFLFLSP